MKAGDKVLCIDNTDREAVLIKGNVYTLRKDPVRHQSSYYICEISVLLEGIVPSLFFSRFISLPDEIDRRQK